MWPKLKTILLTLALALLIRGEAVAQGVVAGQLTVPLGYCQLSATALGSAVKLSSCVRASFTATAGTPATKLVVTSVTGIIKIGDQIVSGTGLTAGTVITAQISGTTGGAGTYLLSATNTASSASSTSGGIPTGATMAYLQAETANVRYRDDGAAPTTAIGNIVTSGIPGIFYIGTLPQLQFIAASGSPLLNVAFYRQ
jgi:hypothetical protein